MAGWSPRQAAALAALLVMFVLGGVFLLWRKGHAVESEFVITPAPAAAPAAAAPSPLPPTPTPPSATPAAPPAAAPADLVVHVAGAVKTPGVLHLPPGSRADDAIRSAGGARTHADLDAINLAMRLEDGQQLFVPSKGRGAGVLAVPPGRVPLAKQDAASAAKEGHAAPAKLTKPGDGMVNLNTATSEELQRLPGVGPAMAQRILDARKATGTFTSPEQLMDVSGIGPKKYERMKAFVRVR